MGHVIVVGAGIGGMTAAIAATEAGLAVTLVEKTDRVGGAAAYSGGQAWVGANHVAQRMGIADSVAVCAAPGCRQRHRPLTGSKSVQ